MKGATCKKKQGDFNFALESRFQLT